MSVQTSLSFSTIDPERLHRIVQGGRSVELIDVRTPGEFHSGHAAIARCEPLDSLDPAKIVAQAGPDEPIYVICRSGERSEKACAAFAAAGLGERVVHVEGGTLAWDKAALPMVRGRYVLPLDRQVRIAVGLLVLLGAGLGYLVNPWFYAFSAYCGAALVFAGITDICPLAWTIARMPWNQTKGPRSTCCS